jgi:hypothetical protein
MPPRSQVGGHTDPSAENPPEWGRLRIISDGNNAMKMDMLV